MNNHPPKPAPILKSTVFAPVDGQAYSTMFVQKTADTPAGPMPVLEIILLRPCGCHFTSHTFGQN